MYTEPAGQVIEGAHLPGAHTMEPLILTLGTIAVAAITAITNWQIARLRVENAKQHAEAASQRASNNDSQQQQINYAIELARAATTAATATATTIAAHTVQEDQRWRSVQDTLVAILNALQDGHTPDTPKE